MGILWAHTGAIGCIVLTVGSPHPWVVESHGSVYRDVTVNSYVGALMPAWAWE